MIAGDKEVSLAHHNWKSEASDDNISNPHQVGTNDGSKKFCYEHDFDTKGLLYWIGTEAGTLSFLEILIVQVMLYVVCQVYVMVIVLMLSHAP